MIRRIQVTPRAHVLWRHVPPQDRWSVRDEGGVPPRRDAPRLRRPRRRRVRARHPFRRRPGLRGPQRVRVDRRAAAGAGDRAAPPAHRDPGPQRRPDRDHLRREPGHRPAPPGLADHGQVDRVHRGLPLLPARRARREGHAPRPVHQPGRRRRGPGWLVDHPAAGQADPAQPGEHQGGARGSDRRHLRPQAARSSATRSRWRRSTPRTGSSSATSTPRTSETARTASRPPPSTTSTSTPSELNLRQSAMLAGHRAEPRCVRSDQQPGPAPASGATSYSTGWPSSASSASAGREDQAHEARPRRPEEAAAAASTPPPSSSASTSSSWLKQDPALGKNPRERWRLVLNGGLTITTSIDMRMQTATQNSRQRPRLPAGGRDRRDGPDRARHRRGQGAGAVARRSARSPGRRSSTTRCRTSTATPTGSSQARRSRRSCWPRPSTRASRSTRPTASRRRRSSRRTSSRPATAPTRAPRLGPHATSTSQPHTVNLYTGTQGSVNTFFAQLETGDRALRAVQPRAAAGRRALEPEDRDGAVVHAGHPGHQPARAGRGLRHLRRPRQALRRAAGPQDRGQPGQRAQGLQAEVHAGAPEPGRRRCQRRARGRAAARRVRPVPLPGPAGGRQDRHVVGQPLGVVRGLHAQPGRGSRSRRCQRGRRAGVAGRQD